MVGTAKETVCTVEHRTADDLIDRNHALLQRQWRPRHTGCWSPTRWPKQSWRPTWRSQPQMRRPTVTERWAKMAEEARAIAIRTRDPEGKRRMLEIADSYDRLAKRSEDLARRREGRSDPTSS
jgi:hypothetical protein